MHNLREHISGHVVEEPVGVLSYPFVTMSFSKTSYCNSFFISGHRKTRGRTRKLKNKHITYVQMFIYTATWFQVNTIKASVKNKHDLTVRILLDANRGSRGKVSSRTMLMPLLNSAFDCRVGNYV